MKRSAKNALVLAFIATTIGCDQVTKEIAQDKLASASAKSYLMDTFRLTYAENSGVFLGLGKGLPEPVRFTLFTVIVGLVLTWILVDTLRRPANEPWLLVPLSMILAGGFANLLDRMLNGGVVVDFMNMGIGPVRTGVFNVADVFITFGVLLFLGIELGRSRWGRSQAHP